VIVVISEVAKRSSGFAALIASLPMTSLLAFIWLRVEGETPAKIAELSEQIFWLIIPSLLLFPLFAGLLRYGMAFWTEPDDFNCCNGNLLSGLSAFVASAWRPFINYQALGPFC